MLEYYTSPRKGVPLNILLITGKSGTGKAGISQAISKKIHATYLQSRAIAHTLAQEDGFTRVHDWIKKRGVSTATHRIHGEILHAIDDAAPDSTILIDGVYNSDLITEIEKRVNKENIRIIEITAPLPERITRIANDTGNDIEATKQELSFLDNLKSQAGLNAIENKANLVVENLEDASTLDVIYTFLSSGDTTSPLLG